MGASSTAQAGGTGGRTDIPDDTVGVYGSTYKEIITDYNSGGFEIDPPGSETGKHTHELKISVEPHNHGNDNLPSFYRLVFIMKVTE